MPRWTLRLRLTALYGALFLAAGAGLLLITYELVSHSSSVSSAGITTPGGPVLAGVPGPQPPGGSALVRQTPVSSSAVLRDYQSRVNARIRQINASQARQIAALTSKARGVLHLQQRTELSSLLAESAVALGIMALLSIGLGWLVAGRALRPVRTMTARARLISERNLHERLAAEGPDDELRELGDTFDGLLGRLEAAFESQRRFVAHASHELRTPITLERTLVEVALADPDASVESLRVACERVIAASEHQERLIDALLTLARSQRGLSKQESLDLSELAGQVLGDLHQNGVRISTELEPAPASGDRALLERLIANLIDNARRYNLPSGGSVSVWTGVRGGRTSLRVSNTGPVISPEEVGALMEPFRRLGNSAEGLGLGLSIVAAIASAHGANLRLAARPEGGLDTELRF